MANQFAEYDDAAERSPQVEGGSASMEETANHEATRKASRARRDEHTEQENKAGEVATRRKGRKGDGSARAAQPKGRTDEDGIVHLRRAKEAPKDAPEVEHDGEAVRELEAQGFTSDEAARIIHLSERLADSREAREAEAALRRLRFTRWLIERGVLDEFSA